MLTDFGRYLRKLRIDVGELIRDKYAGGSSKQLKQLKKKQAFNRWRGIDLLYRKAVGAVSPDVSITTRLKIHWRILFFQKHPTANTQ